MDRTKLISHSYARDRWPHAVASEQTSSKGRREVWLEVGALLLFLGGLFFLNLAGCQLVWQVTQEKLAGTNVNPSIEGSSTEGRELSCGQILPMIIGFILIAGAWAVRFVGERKPPAESSGSLEPSRLQFDPFVLSSETRGRFRMLVVAALLILLYLSGLVAEATQKAGDQTKLDKAVQGFGVIADFANPDPSELADFLRRYIVVMREILPIVSKHLLIILLFFAIFAALAKISYIRHPERIRRRRRVQALDHSKAPNVVEDLHGYAEKLGCPSLRFEHCEGVIGDGQAYGLPGNEALLLTGAPESLERGWGEYLKTIALHEMGHVVNGDAAIREKTRSVWWALQVLVGCFVFVIAVTSWMKSFSVGPEVTAGVFGGGVAALILTSLLPILVARLILVGVIRNREFYSDWRVATWGFGEALNRMLSLRERRNEKWRLWRSHPPYLARRRVLCDSRLLFRVSSSLAFVTGILLIFMVGATPEPFAVFAVFVEGVVCSLFGGTLVSRLPLPLELKVFAVAGFPMLLVAVGLLFIISFVVTSTLGAQVQREAVADLTRGARGWGYLRLFWPAVCLSVGMEIGLFALPLSPLPTAWRDPGLQLLWSLGFATVVWLWLAYLRGGARLLMGTRVCRAFPRLLSTFVLASGAILLSILFLPCAISRLALVASPGMFPSTYTGVHAPEHYYFWSYISIGAILLSVVVALFVVAAAIGLLVFLIYMELRKCHHCGMAVACGFAIGRLCEHCSSRLAPWPYLDTSFPMLHRREADFACHQGESSGSSR